MSRSKNEIIRVFEFQSICYRNESRYYDPLFTQTVYEAFETYFRSNENTPFFELIPYGIRFKQYVGVIQVGKQLIEVLPKAGRDGGKDVWQKVLLDMLKTCTLLTARNTGEAQLKLRSNSILDLYFELYLRELEKLLHQGFIKKYRTEEGQRTALKGALVFSIHISKNCIHKERFYTRHSTYDQSHLLHQILYEALLLISKLSGSSPLTDRIGRLLLEFPEQKRLKITAKHFEKLNFHRKTQSYRKAIEIARLILLNYHPDLSSGKNNFLALMFDMNTLWEEYVYQILRRNYGIEWNIQGQQRKSFWERKQVRPDIFISPKNNHHNIEPKLNFIIGTKWKVIDTHHPADDDLKQMYVYNHHWESYHSMLLYPRTSGQEDQKGFFSLPFANQRHSCSIAFVDVIDENGLSQDLADQIMKKFSE